MSPTERTNFCLLFVGRSGSSRLIDLLRSHPQILAKGEMLVQPRFDSWARQQAWIAHFYTYSRPLTIKAIGFKTKCHDVRDKPAFLRLMDSHHAFGLFLRRRNLVAQVVSWFAAEELYKLHGVWNITTETQRLTSIEIPVAIFSERLRQLETANTVVGQMLRDWRGPTLQLWYEDLATRPVDTLAATQEFLGLERYRLESGLIKHIAAPYSDFIRNYEEITASLRGSIHEGLLGE